MATIALTPTSSALLSGSVAVSRLYEVTASSSAIAGSTASYVRVGERVASSSAIAGSSATYQRVVEAIAASSLVASSSATLSAILNALAASSAVARSTAWYEGAEMDTWASTLDGAVSRYVGFDFHSYVEVGGKVFALGDDGVYELTGTTDAGAPIKWLLQNGPTRKDAAAGNSNPNLHLPGLGFIMPYQAYAVGTVPRDSEVFIIDDREQLYQYALTDTEGRFNTSRRRLGLGLRTRHFMSGLAGKATTEAEIESLTVLASESKRNV